jgi:FAD synthase
MEGARHTSAPFMVEGEVVGDQRGRARLPDRQLRLDDRLAIPGHGVYAAFADGVPAAVNVGVGRLSSGRGVLSRPT